MSGEPTVSAIMAYCVFISDQFSRSVVSYSETPWTAASQASLSITSSRSLLKLMSIEAVMSSNHLICCCPLLLPSIFLSLRVFFNESVLHITWPKYWNFSFSISPSNELRTDFLEDGLVGSPCSPRGSQESFPTSQFKASILQCSVFLIVQLSHPYMTTGKTIGLTRQTFVG